MRAATSLLVPFLLAAFLAVICMPPMHWLLRHRVSPAMAVLLITVALLLVSVLVGAFVGASIADFSHNLPAYQHKLKVRMTDMIAWLGSRGVHLDAEHLLQSFDPGVAMAMAGKLLASFGHMMTNTFLIIFTVILLLIEAVALPGKWRMMGEHAPDTRHVERFVRSVNTYLTIKGLVSLATGVLVAVLLAVVGVDYPILWGLVAFLFHFVPNIGALLAAVPAVLLALVQLGGIPALIVAVGYGVINAVMGNIVEPKFMGKGVGLSTLVVFLSLVFWGWVLGPVGMLLSVPLTMIVKLALETDEETRWLAILLGPDAPALSSEKG
ncbi:MAG: AI-2E family transporter [Zetaproteobacteria bacterium]|nr:MAG: AI-2E family transporter [Zetaproteobacteria bacterium]